MHVFVAKGYSHILLHFLAPSKKDFLGNEVSFQVLPPKNVVLCLFKAGIQTHFLCSINVNHNVKSLNLSENGQKLSSSLRTIVYVKSVCIYFLEIHGVVGGAKSELCIHFLQAGP